MKIFIGIPTIALITYRNIIFKTITFPMTFFTGAIQKNYNRGHIAVSKIDFLIKIFFLIYPDFICAIFWRVPLVKFHSDIPEQYGITGYGVSSTGIQN